MVAEASELPEREERLGEVVFACLKAIDGGQLVDRQEVLARHPEFAADLEEFFADQDRVNRLAAPLREIDAAAQTDETLDAGTTRHHEEGTSPLPPGTGVGPLGDYELLAVIRQGGNGFVYRAHQLSLHRIVALKM